MKSKKKRTKSKKIVLILLILIGLFILFIANSREYYKIEDRTKNVKKEKEKDVDLITTVGWVRVQGTNIDAPIIYYSPKFDSTKDDEGKNNYAYTNTRGEILFNKVNILGHNILNLSKNPRIKDDNFTRFDSLMAFVYPDFVKKNKYIQYTVDNKNYLYKIYSVRLYDSYDNVETVVRKTYTEKEIGKYIKKVKKDSLYKFRLDVNKKDNLISLITCTRFFGKDHEAAFVVDARMVRKGEPIKNYSVRTTDNYKKIKKIMKGDGSNES